MFFFTRLRALAALTVEYYFKTFSVSQNLVTQRVCFNHTFCEAKQCFLLTRSNLCYKYFLGEMTYTLYILSDGQLII